MIRAWRSLPERNRRIIGLVLKASLTVGAFYLLLTFEPDDGKGGKVSIAQAIVDHLKQIEAGTFIVFAMAAALIKFTGIVCSMFRWHLLLQGQGIHFNFFHVVGSFLIGRFLGTFLPSTVGLDSYKLYDAARFSERVVEPAAATVVEKVMGLSGIFLTFLVTLPFGYPVLVDVLGVEEMVVLPWPSVVTMPRAHVAVLLTVSISVAVLVGLFLVIFRPAAVEWLLRWIPAKGRRRVEGIVKRISTAATAYRGKAGLIASVFALSFWVHFATAAMYFFTALAVGAANAEFWMVAFASSIQIFATVLSPITIGGEGIREIVQALLLTKHMGASQAILSAALGFWAAEALTLFGAFFWWLRPTDYRPRKMELHVANHVDGGGPPP